MCSATTLITGGWWRVAVYNTARLRLCERQVSLQSGQVGARKAQEGRERRPFHVNIICTCDLGKTGEKTPWTLDGVQAP